MKDLQNEHTGFSCEISSAYVCSGFAVIINLFNLFPFTGTFTVNVLNILLLPSLLVCDLGESPGAALAGQASTTTSGSFGASSVLALSFEEGSGIVLESFSGSFFVSGAASGSGAASFSGTASSGAGLDSVRVSGVPASGAGSSITAVTDV